MRTDATEIQDRAISRPRRFDLASSGTAVKSFYGWDVLAGAIGLSLLIEHFRARAAYGTCLLLALILPAVLALTSRNYRHRLGAWVRDQWGRLETYSAGAGSGQIPWLAAVVFAVAPAWLLYLSNGQTLGAIDTRPVVPTAISLLTEGNWELGEYFVPGRRKVSLRGSDGQVPLCFQARPNGIYSTYPGGMVPFAVAITGLSAVCDANLDNVEVQAHLQKMTAAPVAAVAIGLFFLVALRLVPARPAWVASAILAAGSGMFSTVAMGLWQHGGIILWSLLILLVEFRRTTHPSRWDSLIQGFACAQMVACRLSSVAFLLPFGIWVFLRSPNRAVAVVASAGLAYLPWGWAYTATYGNPFGPSTGFLSGGLWTLDLAGPMAGVLFSPGRGLLTYQPWIILAFLAALPAIRSRDRPDGPAWRPVGVGAVLRGGHHAASGIDFRLGDLVGWMVLGFPVGGRDRAVLCLALCPADRRSLGFPDGTGRNRCAGIARSADPPARRVLPRLPVERDGGVSGVRVVVVASPVPGVAPRPLMGSIDRLADRLCLPVGSAMLGGQGSAYRGEGRLAVGLDLDEVSAKKGGVRLRGTLGWIWTVLGPFLGLVLISGLFAWLTRDSGTFVQPYNWRTIAVQTVIVGTAALGMTVVMIAGGIDLSVGSAVALVTVIVAILVRDHHVPVPAAMAIGVLLGGGCGLLNGGLISGLGVVPFIITLGSLKVFRGVAKWLSDSTPVYIPQDVKGAWFREVLPMERPSPLWGEPVAGMVW